MSVNDFSVRLMSKNRNQSTFNRFLSKDFMQESRNLFFFMNKQNSSKSKRDLHCFKKWKNADFKISNYKEENIQGF